MNSKNGENMNIRFLDGLRGLAALVVMLGHARLLLWEGYSEGYKTHPEAYSTLDRAMMYGFSLFRVGHEMVILFFVLSGFVIHLRFSNREKRPPFDFKDFMVRRFKRLYPPLLFVLLLAFILDGIGKQYGWAIYAQQTPYASINRDIICESDPITLIGNLFFLMAVYVQPYGTTGVTWSLMYEWWFYVLYPVFYFLALRFGFRKVGLLVTGLFVVAVLMTDFRPLLLWRVLDYFVIWWMGASLVEIWRNRAGSTRRVYAVLPYLVVMLPAGFLMQGKDSDTLYAMANFAFGLGFMGLIAGLLRLKHQNIFIRFLEWIKPLGDCSYTLYLVHFTIFVFASGWLMARGGGFLPTHHFWVIGGSAFSVVLAYALHFFTEKPFISQKNKQPIKLANGHSGEPA